MKNPNGAPPKIEMYTDGSSLGNPGPSGWGVVFKLAIKGREVNRAYTGEIEFGTNQQAELTAVIEGLKHLDRPCIITIFTDSKYVANMVENGWIEGWKSRGWRKKDGEQIKNLELVQEMDELLSVHKVKFQWVKGHNGNMLNELADSIALSSAEKARENSGS